MLRRKIARFARRSGLRAPLPAAPAVAAAPAAAAGEVREYAVPLARSTAPFHLVLKLSIPELPDTMRQSVYGEQAGRTVVALSPSVAAESNDLGVTWATYPVALDLPPRACFTTARGTKLVCTHAAKTAPHGALLYRFDSEWRAAAPAFTVGSPWHGSASIGEARGTIMFAEYPDNAAKYRDDTAPVLPARVWRSRDDGLTWAAVMTVGPDLIRHLHTLAAEPGTPGRWWLTSGDRSSEVFVWRSDDDGDTWSDVTEAAPDVPLHPQYRKHARAVQRMTDLAFHDGHMIWGSDDWLGLNVANADDRPAAGSRIFRAPTDGPWKVEELGYCGKPVRSMVDVGRAFLFTTEAKHLDRGGRPDVFAVFKDDLRKVHHLGQIDNYGTAGTGFTYSFASRAAVDGVFFSHRSTNDVFRSETRMLKWELVLS